MIEELDRVETLVAKESVPAGSRGTVIHVFAHPEPAYEVEFVASDGRPVAQLPYLPPEVRKLPVNQ